MGGVSNKTTSHNYYPGFGFDLLFKVTEVKVKKNYEVGVFCYD
jgi:hypothetical protein